MNILSFDIEEWFFEKLFHDGRIGQFNKLDRYLDEILNLLEKRQIQATFFVVGKMAEDFPQVVRRIAERGHEIGCHSYHHTWLNKMTRDEVLEDTVSAIKALEQCIGHKVKSYRAPAFSVGKHNQWVFEILAQFGIENDSSVFPASRDFGGFPDFGNQEPTLIKTKSGLIKEYPIVMTKILGKNVAFSGGGYFRFFPLWFVKQQMKRNAYNICYFHIADLIPTTHRMMTRVEYEDYFKEPGALINRYKRHLKTNWGKASALQKMNAVVNSFQFVSLTQASEQIDWSICPSFDFG